MGMQTNIGLFLMSNHHLKKNIERIYVMGGAVRASNPTGCCPQNSTGSCVPGQCGNHGNVFSAYHANPNAEFNIFGDPFAAYQVATINYCFASLVVSFVNEIVYNTDVILYC